MLQALAKKSKNKHRQRAQVDTELEPPDSKTASTAPDFRQQRKLHHRKNTGKLRAAEDLQFGGSMRTRSASSRPSYSAMVTFESMQPTQVWQASASPSPPTNTASGRRPKPSRRSSRGVDSLALSMMARAAAENQWLSLSTADEDDLSDSSDYEDVGDLKHQSKPSIPRSSLSSSDTSSSLETSRKQSSSSSYHQRRTKKHSRRNRRSSPSPPGSSSDSSSSSSSSEEENEFDLCWKMKTSGSLGSATPIQSTPQLKRTPLHHHQAIVVQPSGTPQVMSRFPGNQFSRPQTIGMQPGGNPFQRPMSARSSSKETPFVHSLARAIEDFFPTLEWVEKYKVIAVHRGDLLRIIPYPGTNPEKTSPTSGWFLAQKWCTDHASGTGPIGFVPRIVCSFGCPESAAVTPRLPLINPRHALSQDFSLKNPECSAFMTTSHELRPTLCDAASELLNARSIFPSPALGIPGVPIVKTSLTSIPAVYEIEDRDSGRGPSSGSEWSSGKGGSLSGATDLNLDEKVHQPTTRSSPKKWPPIGHLRRASFDQQSSTTTTATTTTTFSSPLPPPPMVLLSHVRADALAETKKECSSDTDGAIAVPVNGRSRLYVRGADEKRSEAGSSLTGECGGGGAADDDEGDVEGSPPTVVVPSNSDPSHWEPYKTMIEVGQNKLEKFTLV